MSVKVKGGIRATISRPSLQVNMQGQIGADIHRGQPCATLTDVGTQSKLFIPFSYIPITLGAPTDHPPEFGGFVPLRLDVLGNALYYYYNGRWIAVAGGGVSPVPESVFLFGDSSIITFGDNSEIAYG